MRGDISADVVVLRRPARDEQARRRRIRQRGAERRQHLRDSLLRRNASRTHEHHRTVRNPVLRANPAPRDTNTGAIQVGGGIDISAVRWLGFRGEVRDIYTGARNFSLPTPQPSVHNVVASGGLVVRF